MTNMSKESLSTSHYLSGAESMISADMQETMKRLVFIEKLAEEILTLKH